MDDSRQDGSRRDLFPGEVNPFRDNPYVAPSEDGSPFAGQAALPPGSGKVHHVRVVAVLMIVQGGLQMVMGVLLMAMGIGLPMMMRMDAAARPGRAAGMPPEGMTWILLVIYGGLGLLVLTSAGLLIFAGIRNYQLRNRVFGIVAIACGAVTVLTCYCAPTAIGLAIYGLIVYLDPWVIHAFATRKAELDKDVMQPSID